MLNSLNKFLCLRLVGANVAVAKLKHLLDLYKGFEASLTRSHVRKLIVIKDWVSDVDSVIKLIMQAAVY